MTTPLPSGYRNGANEGDAAPHVAVVDDNVASGAAGNPAILASGNALAPTNKPDIKYAMVLPDVKIIVKVVAVQILPSAYGVAAS